ILRLCARRVVARGVEIAERQLGVPAIRPRRPVERLEQPRLGVAVASRLARGARLLQERPERDAAQRRLPQLAVRRREPARALEQLARARQILLALGGEGLALRHDGEPEARVGVVAARLEEPLRAGEVAAL